MRKQIHKSSLIFYLILSLSIFCNIQPVKGESNLAVEGEWEVISVSLDTERSFIGSKISISRKSDGYEVKKGANDNNPWFCTGNATRIVHTEIELLHRPEDSFEGDRIPAAVKRQLAGQQVPINYSYTLSADGNFLTNEVDSKYFYWDINTATGEVRNVRYEIKPGYNKRILKRISGLTKVENRSAIAQVESRGEFYVLTKDGRKLTGKDANQIPIEEGTKVITGSDGHIRMKLPDDTTFTIGPNSDIVIDSFVYDPDNTPKKVIANVSKGVFRWVTGKVKPLQEPAEMKVKLPVVHIGIRGTDFEATVDPDGSGFVILHFGQLEITEKKTGFKFILDAGYKVTYGADGSISRPIKAE